MSFEEGGQDILIATPISVSYFTQSHSQTSLISYPGLILKPVSYSYCCVFIVCMLQGLVYKEEKDFHTDEQGWLGYASVCVGVEGRELTCVGVEGRGLTCV